MQLREYQQQALDICLESVSDKKPTVLCLPTGTGKSVVINKLTEKLLGDGYNVLVVVPSILLVENLENYFENCDRVVGKRVLENNCLVGVFLSVATRLERIKEWQGDRPLVVIHDEAHHSAATNWQKILKLTADCHVGFSATPLRLDGKPLKGFERCSQIEDINWYIENKYLSDVLELGVESPNVEGVLHDLEGQYEKLKTEHPRYLENWQRYAFRPDGSTRPTIIYGCNITHCNEIAATYNAVYPDKFRVISSKDSKKFIGQAIADFTAGKLWGLVNVQLLTEGVDLPFAKVVQLCRATDSISLFRQMVGRVLRPYGDESAIVLDHAGNLDRLGSIKSPVNWEALFNKIPETKVKKPAQALCPACHFGSMVEGICNYCAYAMPIKKKKKDIIQTDENLVEFKDSLQRRIQGLRSSRSRSTHEAKLRALIYKNMPDHLFCLVVLEIEAVRQGLSQKILTELEHLRK